MIPTLQHVRLFLRVLLYGAGCIVVGVLCMMLYVISQFDGTAEFPTDCAVVFGAAVHSVGTPGPGINRRVQTATRLYAEGKVNSLFLTGGKGSAEQASEAQVMRRVAMREGVPPEDILLEEEAHSTWQNLELVRPLMADCQSAVGISDRYHLARIQSLAWIQGWGPLTTYPADQTSTFRFEVRSVLREALALIYYSIILVFDSDARAQLSYPNGEKPTFGLLSSHSR